MYEKFDFYRITLKPYQVLGNGCLPYGNNIELAKCHWTASLLAMSLELFTIGLNLRFWIKRMTQLPRLPVILYFFLT